MIQVIHRALNILEFLSQDPQKEYFLSEISESLGLNKATCANIIRTLTDRGYIEHEEQRKGYRLGHMAYRLTNSTFNRGLDYAFAKEEVDRLRDIINENVILSVVSNGKRILIHEAETDHELAVKTTYEQSPYKASTGKVILAHYTSDQLDNFINRYGLPSESEWEGVDSKEELVRRLEVIREAPVYVHTNSKHVASVTVPIFSKNKIVASLGVYLPDIRFSQTDKDLIISALLNTAKKIQH